ncbi:hypothetical protein [Exiguobacterium profundum]|nr:hypothetical protein [Exiguobacterium profundum]
MNEWISSILSIVVVLVFLVGLEQVGKRLDGRMKRFEKVYISQSGIGRY